MKNLKVFIDGIEQCITTVDLYDGYYLDGYTIRGIVSTKGAPLCGAPDIDKVIFNDPATIVIWKDGSKTVVKAHNEPYDKEKGLAMCIAKKVLGNKGNYFNTIKKWLKEE